MIKLPKFHLLSTNTKLRKSDNSGYLLLGLQLAPDNTSGFQVCPAAKSAGCRPGCIYESGIARAFPRVNAFRIEKTRRFFTDRKVFLLELQADIERAYKFADDAGLTLAIRLNVFSDIFWRDINIPSFDVPSGRTLFGEYPHVQFFDYTKMLGNLGHGFKNYYVNFSHSPLVPDRTIEAISRFGVNPVVVYDLPKHAPLPETFEIGPFSLPVIDGDINDLRFIDPPGVSVGVREKLTHKKSTLSIRA